MTGLLEIREKIKSIYSKYEVFILPLVKFLLAFLVISSVNGQLGYMTRLDNVAIVLIAALMCSFLPAGAIILFAALFSLMHMYALSMEVALVGLCVYLLMFLLFFRFSPRDSLVVVLTPILCGMGVPYVMPVAMGLLGTPASAISVGCGVVVHFLLNAVADNASTINTMDTQDITGKLRLIIDAILNNQAMMVMVAAFAVTVLVVYLIRRMSVDYSWTIAMIAGVMVELVILLVGDLMYDTNLSVIQAVIGAAVTVLAAKLIEFFRFCVDYSRTEKVQFEDDEYYYYVKAVPKMSVAVPAKTVKHINTQRRATAQPADRRNSAPQAERRNVTTVKTGTRTAAGSTQHRNEHLSGGRSVTINSNNLSGKDGDDYEELF